MRGIALAIVFTAFVIKNEGKCGRGTLENSDLTLIIIIFLTTLFTIAGGW